ncbi:MAG TPA: hypothetical protein PKM63_14450 [Panacibacter sp.]|nr:hypothetical protein [Panacibacter sp.]HNP45488.1 hypothetical protein [Panacibacter sp.]
MAIQTTDNNYFKSLTVLYTALLAGQVIFLLLSVFLVFSGNFVNRMPELENIFFIAVPASIIIARLAGNLLFKRKVQDAVNMTSNSDKLNAYRAAFLTRCALLEFSTLFAIISFLLTNRMELLVFAAGGLFLFVTLKPSKEKVANTLQVSEADIS